MTHNEHYWHHHDYEIDIADLDAIEDERFRELCPLSDSQLKQQAKDDLIEEVYRLVNSIALDLVSTSWKKEEDINFPSETVLNSFKDQLIKFKTRITKVEKNNLAMEKALNEIEALKSKNYTVPWTKRDREYYDKLDLLDFANNLQRAQGKTIIDNNRWS
jgi:hypothetical protein